MILRAAILLIGLAVAATAPGEGRAGGATLTIVGGDATRQVDRDQLLARTDAVEITVPRDVAYGARRSYRAVPLAALLGVPTSGDQMLEAEAEDGFVAQLPLEPVNNRDMGQAVAYVAIETADKPWPNIPNKERSAGPFYIVWLGVGAPSVPALLWPYQVFRLSVQDAPTKRWPALAVDAALPALDPARAGQSLFARTCFACHTMNRAGLAAVGPDLNLPMNPTEYFTDTALRALIRDPRALRTWPEQRMPGFSADQLSDEEIGLIIAYLRHMAGRKLPAAEGTRP